jgi:hypothetical protein
MTHERTPKDLSTEERAEALRGRLEAMAEAVEVCKLGLRNRLEATFRTQHPEVDASRLAAAVVDALFSQPPSREEGRAFLRAHGSRVAQALQEAKADSEVAQLAEAGAALESVRVRAGELLKTEGLLRPERIAQAEEMVAQSGFRVEGAAERPGFTGEFVGAISKGKVVTAWKLGPPEKVTFPGAGWELDRDLRDPEAAAELRREGHSEAAIQALQQWQDGLRGPDGKVSLDKTKVEMRAALRASARGTVGKASVYVAILGAVGFAVAAVATQDPWWLLGVPLAAIAARPLLHWWATEVFGPGGSQAGGPPTPRVRVNVKFKVTRKGEKEPPKGE